MHRPATTPTRPRAAVLLVVSVVLLAIPAAPIAAARSLPEYRYETTACENTYLLSPTTAAQVRAEVPERFGVLGEAAGTATMGLMITACDMVLNGRDLGRVSWSDVGVLIDPPDSVFDEEPKIHIYWLWTVSDSRALVHAADRWGVETALVDVDTVYGPGLPVATSAGAVEAPWGHYAAQGTWEGHVHPAVEGTVSWWHESPFGVARFDQAFTNDTEQCGVGLVTAEGRLARLAGGTAVGAHGCITFADLIGSMRLVG